MKEAGKDLTKGTLKEEWRSGRFLKDFLGLEGRELAGEPVS